MDPAGGQAHGLGREHHVLEATGAVILGRGGFGLQNMMLAAQSLGLGSCWVHVPARLDDSPESQALRAELGIPPSHRIHGSIALGYAAGPAPKGPERKAGAVAILD